MIGRNNFGKSDNSVPVESKSFKCSSNGYKNSTLSFASSLAVNTSLHNFANGVQYVDLD